MLFGCSAAALAACSSGSEVSATFTSPGGEESSGGSGGSGGAVVPVPGSSSADGASSSASSSSGSGGAGGGGGAGGSGCDHSTSQTCVGAMELSSINGDTGSDTRTVKGTKAAWFKVLVHEDSLLSNSLSYTATLIPPPGLVFQLFAFEGDGSSPNCLGEALVAVGDPPSVSGSWSDAFASDDDRWIGFEVRYISGEACDPAPEWTLTVKGHTN